MKHAKIFLSLLVLCLALAACGAKEQVPNASASSADISSAAPDVSPSEGDTSTPDSSEPEPLPPLTEADKASAQDAARDYYLGTVFEVHALTEIDTRAGEITFQVSCSKGGEAVDPDRTISLERQNGAWMVVAEGY